jgi:hypothetical protein
MSREREKLFEFRFEINGFLHGLPPSNPIQGRGRIKKGGWQIMGRLIILCLIFLSAFFFPGNAAAIIIGEVWNTGALSSAANPALGPPAGVPPAATFTVNGDINFTGNTLSLTFGQFLNSPSDWTSSSINLADLMFSKTSTVPDQGIFFRFTMSLEIPAGPLPITVIHDDGFSFSVLNAFEFSGATGQVTGTTVTTFDVKGFDPGTYTATLNYGALNDTANHVLIFSTPEPWTMLLLGLGLIGIGILRKKI